MADKKPSAKSKVEAVLFSVGHRIRLEEVAKLCRILKEDALAALKELQKEYDEKQSSIMLVDDGEYWKFAVRDHLISVVRKIVTETELTRSVLETLAVIAFKYPILQSDLIKIRTNKAYDHLVELEKAGYISRQKHSRTNLIKLTEKFFKYFDLTEEKLRDQFKDFSSIAAAIAQKEVEFDQLKEDQRKRAKDLGEQDEKIKKEIESLDDAEESYEIPLDTYEEKKDGSSCEKTEQNIQSTDKNSESENKNTAEESEAKEILKEVEIVDIKPLKEQNEKKEHKKETEEKNLAQEPDTDSFQNENSNENKIQNNNSSNETSKNSIANNKEHKRKRGIHLTPEQDKIAEKRADDIIAGKGEEQK